jgi:uncharacterized protein
MPTLAETYATLHAVLRGKQGIDEGATELGVDPARLAIYANFVRGHITGILEKQYPRVSQTLSAAPWQHLCEGFYAAHPATHWELNAAAEPFPAYVAEQLGILDEVSLFHVGMAQFEWAQWAAFSDPSRIPDASTLRRDVINPTLRILELPCPVIDAVLSLDRDGTLGAELPDAGAGPEVVLIFRHPLRETSAFWRVTDALTLALTTVDAGIDVAESAARLGRSIDEVTKGLSRAREVGLIIEPTG